MTQSTWHSLNIPQNTAPSLNEFVLKLEYTKLSSHQPKFQLKMLDRGKYSPAAEPYSYMNEITTTTTTRKKKCKNKKRFSDEQIRSLELVFEKETRLEPQKKLQLAPNWAITLQRKPKLIIYTLLYYLRSS